MDHRDGDAKFIDRSARAIAAEKLRELQKPGDTEISHSMADDVLCELLVKLGCSDVVEEWKKVEKWYA